MGSVGIMIVLLRLLVARVNCWGTYQYSLLSGSESSVISSSAPGGIGVYSASNTPGSLWGAFGFGTGTLENGSSTSSMFLFGGFSPSGLQNTLWEYGLSEQEWRWISGSLSSSSSVLSEFSPTFTIINSPPQLYGGASFRYSATQLFLFGGYQKQYPDFGHSASLWEYRVDLEQWKWWGPTPEIDVDGIYGTGLIFSPNVYPGARLNMGSSHISSSLYIYGGVTSSTILGDLWQYSVTSRSWKWENVAEATKLPLCFSVFSESSAYGVGYHPSARESPMMFFRDVFNVSMAVRYPISKKSLFLFGGRGYSSSTQTLSMLADLWEFSVVQGQWRIVQTPFWAKDSNAYGVNGIPVPSIYSKAYPGARLGAATFSVGDSFFMFGGYGFSPSSRTKAIELNDLWQFDVSRYEWKRPIIQGPYIPTGRHSAAVLQDGGMLYMYGGRSNSGEMVDLFSLSLVECYANYSGPTCLETTCSGVNSGSVDVCFGPLFGEICWLLNTCVCRYFSGVLCGDGAPPDADGHPRFGTDFLVYVFCFILWAICT